jgi:Arc/MetJ family transcription regulator
MRTTLDLPEELIKKVMKITNSKTKTEVIKKALNEMLEKNDLLEIKKYKGKINLEIDLDNLRSRT